MKTAIALGVLCLLTADVIAADDLRTLVTAAIAKEIAIFDDMEVRFEKDKLKPAEKQFLFDKKTVSKKQRKERLAEVREQVLAGEVSFQILNGTGRIGDCGCLLKSRIRVRQIVGADAFLGGWWEDFVAVPPWLFRGVPGSDKLIDNDEIIITRPMLITGRHSYSTVAAGTKTTLVVEPLSVCVQKLKNEKKK